MRAEVKSRQTKTRVYMLLVNYTI